MSESKSESKSEMYPLHLLLLIGGGLSLGTGIIMLYDSFGWLGGDINSNFAEMGFSGLDNISLINNYGLAFPLLTIGALALVFANATAWRETDGY